MSHFWRTIPEDTTGIDRHGPGVAASTDGARTWRACPFPDTAGGIIWSVATAAEPAGLVLACSLGGKVFVSPDGGESWKLALDCGAPARAVACTVD